MDNNAKVLEAIDDAITALKKLRETIANVPERSEDNKEKIKWDGVEKTLIKLGVFPNCLGYRYLCYAIRLVLEGENYKRITRDLYPEIAKFYNSSNSKVERAIRTAIKSSWERADKELQRKIFPNAESTVTNGMYIFTVAEYLRMTI